MKKSVLKYVLISFLGLGFFSCSDDYDDEPVSASVGDFIWNGLNTYYYWLEDSPDLADNRFGSTAEYYSFLDSFSSPQNLFDHLLYQKGTVDHFSVLYSDYTVLEQALTGNLGSNGVEFKLFKSSTSDAVYGVVTYILPNSDASTKNIERGDVFFAVNGTNLNTSNYQSLLGNETYTLSMASIQNGGIISTGETITLTKYPYSENPVYITDTFTVGTKKIGYLMYNGFYTDYEPALNNAFAYFQSEAVTHLILDLRYNSGGSVATATRLASMITGQFTGQVFAQQDWNYKVEDYLSDNPESLINRFTTTLDNGSSINSLNLSSIYVITSNRTASASELVINGLKPYINVVQIGDTTLGKNVGSRTLYDSPTFNKQNLNPNHRYAMQPIVLKIANANGFADYSDGLTATVNQVEDISNLGVLGETSDPLLDTTLNYIDANGRFSPTLASPSPFTEIKASISAIEELKTEMYID